MDPSEKKSSKKGERKTGFRVVSTSYPSGRGCYFGQDYDYDYIRSCSATKVVGEFDTMEEAKAAAIAERGWTAQFDDWAEEFYGDEPPPYESHNGDNPDEDEDVIIDIEDIAEEIAGKERALEKARKSAPPKKKAKTTASATGGPAPRVFGPAKGNFKPDDGIFVRNTCRVAGGQSHLPSEYGNGGSGKNSFAYLIQRISDRNYAMRSLCLDGSGARYTSFKKPDTINRCVAWIPGSNLNDHAKDATTLDACHMDLIHPKTGKCLLTSENLLAAAKPEIRCMFLNNYQDCSRTKKKVDPNDVVKAITACPGLQCFSLHECVVSNGIFQALASCSDLRGLTLSMLQNKPGEKATDEGLAAIFRACPKLTWIFADTEIFGAASWQALANGSCPNLEVLWVDSTKTVDGRFGVARGDHNVIRRALSQRASTLKLCMVNPDEKLKSRYIIGGAKKTDRLQGQKIPNMPEFDEYDLDFY